MVVVVVDVGTELVDCAVDFAFDPDPDPESDPELADFLLEQPYYYM